MDKMVWTKWYTDKMVRTKWYGQNGMDKMVSGQNGIGQNGMDKMARTKWYGSNITNKVINQFSFLLCACHLFMTLGSFIPFISAISIAPLQVLYYSEALPTTARILYQSFTPKRTGNCRYRTCPRSLRGG